MIIAKTIEEAREAIRTARSQNRTIGFVPTMGALHDGHLSLVKTASAHADFIAMSIFVNPIQFNDQADYINYPRDNSRDLALVEKAGVNLVFLPSEATMYKNHLTYVDTTSLDRYLCGATRPGHFRGVCTVVMKLFNIIQPDVAVFGQKDIQQARILDKMVEDLNIPLKLIVSPIVREADGLAMSSRNIHLTPEQRSRALSLSQALRKGKELVAAGTLSPREIEKEVRTILEKGSPDAIDYVSLVDYETLAQADTVTEKSVLALAAFFGSTRLIDNMIIEKGDSSR